MSPINKARGTMPTKPLLSEELNRHLVHLFSQYPMELRIT